MKIATYNINGINGRLPNLLRWLAEAKPDIVCLQELKCTDEKFPERALLGLGLSRYLAWAAKLEWSSYFIQVRNKRNSSGVGWRAR